MWSTAENPSSDYTLVPPLVQPFPLFLTAIKPERPIQRQD